MMRLKSALLGIFSIQDRIESQDSRITYKEHEGPHAEREESGPNPLDE
jgi:hypothetical protein